MGKITYVTGGARSGKSTFAEKYILEKNLPKVYIATAIPFDAEMKMRVEKHREQRGKNWLTIEGYKDLGNRLKESVRDEKIVLMDCLTNMVSNLMIMEGEYDWDNISKSALYKLESEIQSEVEEVLEYVDKSDIELVVVSNELGMGLVPPYALGRHFRDIAGRMNQLIAARADNAYLVVSGIPMKLK